MPTNKRNDLNYPTLGQKMNFTSNSKIKASKILKDD
jgi:hypothetical protein